MWSGECESIARHLEGADEHFCELLSPNRVYILDIIPYGCLQL